MSNERAFVPPGWEYDPSTYGQRAPLLIASALGLLTAIPCMLHVRGVIDALWEPFPRVVDGWVLEAVPADAPVLDVTCFGLLLVLGAVGSVARWRSRPAVPIAAAAIAAFEAASAVLRWSVQYSTLGTTSTLFTITTACAIGALPMTLDEAYAAVSYRHRARMAASPYREPAGTHGRVVVRRATDWTGYIAGAAAIFVGGWLLVAPLPPRSAGDAHLVGALVVAIGSLTLVQVARGARWVNAALGVWLVSVPLAHAYGVRGTIHFLVAGLILIMLPALGDPVSRADAGSQARHA